MSTDNKCPHCHSKEQELELAYMSIETMKNKIFILEDELKKRIEDDRKPHPSSPGWSGDSTGHSDGW